MLSLKIDSDVVDLRIFSFFWSESLSREPHSQFTALVLVLGVTYSVGEGLPPCEQVTCLDGWVLTPQIDSDVVDFKDFQFFWPESLSREPHSQFTALLLVLGVTYSVGEGLPACQRVT